MSRNELGLYLYCVGGPGIDAELDVKGLDGNKAQALSYKDLCVMAHDCCPKPYNSDDEEVIKNWVLSHENVVEAAWEKYGAVLPFSFNTIIESSESVGAQARLRSWLESEYQQLRSALDKLRGKAEYVIQVFWDQQKVIGGKLVELTTELAAAERELLSDSRTKGRAYMKKQQLESIIKKERALLREESFKKFYNQIKKHAELICIEKTKNSIGEEMLLSLACLVDDAQAKELGLELDDIDRLDSFSVRFVGPWPPYSFVGKEMRFGK